MEAENNAACRRQHANSLCNFGRRTCVFANQSSDGLHSQCWLQTAYAEFWGNPVLLTPTPLDVRRIVCHIVHRGAGLVLL